MLTLQLRPNVTVLAVLVPDYAKDPWLMETEFPRLGYYDPNRALDDNMWSESIELPPGKWEIIGLLREVSETVAASLVEYSKEVSGWLSISDIHDKPIEALRHSITASGGDPKANYLLLKQIQ